MIQVSTITPVMDNTGIQNVRCLRILGKTKKCAQIGDILVVAVTSLKDNELSKYETKKEIYKIGQLCFAIVIRTRQNNELFTGDRVWFDSNGVAILKNNKSELMGKYLIGPVSSFLDSHPISLLFAAEPKEIF